MWQQIKAIAWAQFRISRNHLPRTGVGALLLGLLSSIWYALYAAIAVALAIMLPEVARPELENWISVALLGVFLFWQVVPLFTLSSGWSLQLKKLQVYPVPESALFGLEVFLRITTAPEMILVLLGAIVGLFRRPDIPFPCPAFLLLYIPFNLFLQLAIRDLILHSFSRNRFRELFAVIMISIAVVPQLLARSGAGQRLQPYVFILARSPATPWHDVAALSMGAFSILRIAILLFWILATSEFARRQFAKSLRDENILRGGVPEARPADATAKRSWAARFSEWPNRVFSDPIAALIQKEFRSLIRMPRFRVMFGMACVFSVVVFVPVALGRGRHAEPEFMRQNFTTIASLYGLLLLSEILLLNVFGFDRGATQIYFVSPLSLRTALKAKNFAAITFIALQVSAVLLLGALVRAPMTATGVATGLLSCAVVVIYLLSIGNFTSVTMARPIDPTQTFKKQASAKMQLWILLCTVGMFLLVGFAFLARWAAANDWAGLGILLLELAIGAIVYRFALDAAVEHGQRKREALVDALSKSGSPISLG